MFERNIKFELIHLSTITKIGVFIVQIVIGTYGHILLFFLYHSNRGVRMTTYKNIQYLNKEYKAGFHKFSTIGDGSCNIHPDILVTSNVIDILSIRASNVGIGMMNPVVSLDTNRKNAYKLPAGSTLQRPEGVQGYIRYNTDTSQFEGFGAGNS